MSYIYRGTACFEALDFFLECYTLARNVQGFIYKALYIVEVYNYTWWRDRLFTCPSAMYATAMYAIPQINMLVCTHIAYPMFFMLHLFQEMS